MNTRHKPFELIDYLKSHNVEARLGVGRISIPAYGWYFNLKSAELFEARPGLPARLLVSFSIHDDSSVIANYIVGYHAALRKRAIA